MSRRWLLAIAIAVTACYSEPDYAGTRFRCTPEQGCPSGQMCIRGTCARTVGVDAGIDAPPGTPTGIFCGPIRCIEGALCCVPSVGVPYCSLTSVGCQKFATCDTAADNCEMTEGCCQTPTGADCADYLGCAVDVCDTNDDCFFTTGKCCPGAGVPWKVCANC